jgi:hypothetical protein
MRGRPRKPGKRTPKGVLRNSERGETPDQIKQVVRAQRARHGAVAGDHLDVTLQGYPLGRLRLRGELTQPQYEAGKRFAEIVSRYSFLVTGRRLTVSAVDLSAAPGASLTEPSPESIARAKNDWRATADCLREFGRLHKAGDIESALIRLCVTDDFDDWGRWGGQTARLYVSALNVLASLYGLDGRGKSV